MELLTSFYKKHTRLIFYVAAFMLPVLMTLLLFAVRHIFPFGDVTFLKKDMYQQYTPFFYEYYRKLKNGESLWYSWNAGMGANFLAVIVYYLASPLNFLCALFPEKYILEFMTYSVVIKTGLMGLTCSLYFSYHFKRHDPAMIVFSLAYSMSAYMAAYSWNIEWMDVLFAAPLVLFGLELLCDGKSPLVYYLSLSYAIFTNYYLSIMLCIYVVIYFIMQLILKQVKAQTVVNFVLFSLLSGGTAAIYIMPEFNALKFTTFTNIRFPVEAKFYLNPLELFSRHLFGVTPETGLEHHPNIYCGLMVLILVAIYALSKKISLKEKLVYLIPVLFFLLSFDLNMLNFIWHGLNYPDSLPARQGYLYILLLLLIAYRGFLILRETELKGFYISLGGVYLLIAVTTFLTDKKNLDDIAKILTYVLAVCIVALILFYRSAPAKKYFPGNGQELFFRYALLLTLAFEIVLNMYYTGNRTVKRTEYFSKFEGFKILNAEKAMIDAENDSPLSRADEVGRNVRNDSMMIDYPSLSFFSSTVNGLLIKYLNKYGFMNSRVFYLSDGSTAFTALFAGQRYVFVPPGKLFTSDDIAQPVRFSNTAALYELKCSLPNGYVLHCNDEIRDKLFIPSDRAEEIIDSDLNPPNSSGSPIDAQNAILRDLNISGTALINYGTIDQGNIKKKDNTITVTYNDNCHLYAYNHSKTKAELKVNVSDGTSLGKMAANKYRYILDLGYHASGTEITFVSEDKTDTELDLEFYRMNPSVLASFTETVNNNEKLYDVKLEDDSMTGSIDMKTNGSLVLSVPYEPGWSLKVDGEEAPIDLFDGLWISTLLPEGHHDIRIDFFPEGFKKGRIISMISLVTACLTLFYGNLTRKRLKKHKASHSGS